MGAEIWKQKQIGSRIPSFIDSSHEWEYTNISMLSYSLRNITRSIQSLSRGFASATRHLRTKGHVSPRNTYPAGMLAPCYANSDLDEPGQLDISLVGEDVIEFGIFHL